MRTSAALTAADGAPAPAAGRPGRRRQPGRQPRGDRVSGSSPAAGALPTSVSAAMARRVARATASARRSARRGSVAPHSTSAQRMRSNVGVSGHGPMSGSAPVPRLLGLPQQLGHLLEAVRARQVGGGPAAVDRAELLVELGHAGGHGGEAVAVCRPPRLRAASASMARGRRGSPAATGPDGTRAGRGSRRRTGSAP